MKAEYKIVGIAMIAGVALAVAGCPMPRRKVIPIDPTTAATVTTAVGKLVSVTFDTLEAIPKPFVELCV